MRTILQQLKLTLLPIALISAFSHAQDNANEIIISDQPAHVTTTSQLNGPAHEPQRYSPHKLFDNDVKTAWVEGAQGVQGQHAIHIVFNQAVAINAIAVLPGYTKSARLFAANAVPEQVTLALDNQLFHGQFRYLTQSIFDANDNPQCLHTEHNANLGYKIFVPALTQKVTKVSFIFNSAITGSRYTDMAVSEIHFIGGSFNPAPEIDSLVKAFRQLQHAPFMQAKVPSYQFEYDQNSGWQLAPSSAETPAQRYMIEDYQTNHELINAHFLNTWLDLDTQNGIQTLIGSMVASMGDGEWIEASPALQFTQADTRFAWRYHRDSTPGCHYVYPMQVKPITGSLLFPEQAKVPLILTN